MRTVLVDLAPLPVRTWIVLGAWAGLRCLEIAGLEGDDLRQGWLYVRCGKGGHQRMVPACLEVERALAAHPGAQGRLWDATPGRVSALGNDWLRRLDAGGTMHQLRHTFVTGVDEQYRRPARHAAVAARPRLPGHDRHLRTGVRQRLRDAVAATFDRQEAA